MLLATVYCALLWILAHYDRVNAFLLHHSI